MRYEMLPDEAKPTLASKLDALANAAAAVTVAADADQFWALDWLSWSYSGAPTGGKLTVAIGGTTVWEIDVTAAGPQHFEFNRPMYVGTKNQALVVTLAAGGAGVIGKVNCRYR